MSPLSTRSQQCSFSDGSRTRQMFVYADNFQSARTFQTMLVLHRVHGRVHSTRVFQNSYVNKYTEHQIRSSHGSRARRDETRDSCCSSTRRDQARTSHCVREETQRLRIAPSARTKQEDRFARFNVRGHKTFSWQSLPSGVGAITRSQEHNTNTESSTTRCVT